MRISDWSSDVCSSDLNEIAEAILIVFKLTQMIDDPHPAAFGGDVAAHQLAIAGAIGRDRFRAEGEGGSGPTGRKQCKRAQLAEKTGSTRHAVPAPAHFTTGPFAPTRTSAGWGSAGEVLLDL